MEYLETPLFSKTIGNTVETTEKVPITKLQNGNSSLSSFAAHFQLKNNLGEWLDKYTLLDDIEKIYGEYLELAKEVTNPVGKEVMEFLEIPSFSETDGNTVKTTQKIPITKLQNGNSSLSSVAAHIALNYYLKKWLDKHNCLNDIKKRYGVYISRKTNVTVPDTTKTGNLSSSNKPFANNPS